MASLSDEISSRRTFAIQSATPDAGKTTLTEKLLLYTGSIQTAGSVKGKQLGQACRLGLDGHREGARYLRYLLGAAVHL